MRILTILLLLLFLSGSLAYADYFQCTSSCDSIAFKCGQSCATYLGCFNQCADAKIDCYNSCGQGDVPSFQPYPWPLLRYRF